MGKLFGTDGVRGIANEEPMTPETVVKLGRAVAYLTRRPGQQSSIVIGKDTRLTGYMLECALTSGICSMGVDVLLVGPLPTPGIAFIIRSLRADGGVVISASHNPPDDNGVKTYDSFGSQPVAPADQQLIDLVAPTLGDVIIGLHGQEVPTADGPVRLSTARQIDTKEGPRQTADQPVRFLKLGTFASIQHSLTSPSI